MEMMDYVTEYLDSSNGYYVSGVKAPKLSEAIDRIIVEARETITKAIIAPKILGEKVAFKLNNKAEEHEL